MPPFTKLTCLLLLSFSLTESVLCIRIPSSSTILTEGLKASFSKQAPFIQIVDTDKALFDKWDAEDFIAVDDRVRGGKSQSFLEVNNQENTARFYGYLDIKTLGNAGFASQATKSDQRRWNLSKYGGIKFTTLEGDNKNYSISFKNIFVRQTPDGSQESAMEYKYVFKGGPRKATQFVKFDQFRPTYRGRIINDAPPLNTSDIRVIQFQIASGFGQQQGPFNIKFQDIIASR